MIQRRFITLLSQPSRGLAKITSMYCHTRVTGCVFRFGIFPSEGKNHTLEWLRKLIKKGHGRQSVQTWGRPSDQTLPLEMESQRFRLEKGGADRDPFRDTFSAENQNLASVYIQFLQEEPDLVISTPITRTKITQINHTINWTDGVKRTCPCFRLNS